MLVAVALVAPASNLIDGRPFVKWVGGKRQLIAHLVRHSPTRTQIGTYYEPFVGGGALFFHLQPQRAVLADRNERLIRTYRGVRDQVEEVIDRLTVFTHLHDKHFFMKMRALDVDRLTDAGVAAWFIYLNQTAYNGLYRVNSRNLFNVPFGDYRKPRICNAENLRACARILQVATGYRMPGGDDPIRVADFRETCRDANAGDFVYLDPPYVPLTATASFTDYTSGGFDDEDQVRLRDTAAELKARGVRVLVSNSSSPRVVAWYKDFRRVAVRARRSVNSKADARGAIRELIIY